MTIQASLFDRNGAQSARLIGDFFYRIDGDHAQLGADVTIPAEPSIYPQHYMLQLWACETAYDGGLLDGIKVAERPVYSPENAGLNASDFILALPPAGQHNYVMVMVLAGIDENGNTQVLDYTNFDYRQAFIQPMILGNVDCDLVPGHADLSIERILNPRAAGNLSGSLSLDLWALNGSYNGGAFAGIQLASTEIGTLCGGFEWANNHIRLDADPMPAGDWTLVLMLREWTEAGYLTRDYRTLQAPASEAVAVAESISVSIADALVEPQVDAIAWQVDAPPVETAAGQAEAQPAEPVATVTAEQVEAQPDEMAVEAAAERVETHADESAAEAAAGQAEAQPAEATVEAPAGESTAEAASGHVEAQPAETAVEAVAERVDAHQPGKVPAKAGKAAKKKDSTVAAEKGDDSSTVSINQASTQQLSKVKGISAKLADSIVAGRPYDSVDELVKIRGIGSRTLKRIRTFLGL